jgi:hypothetical protein
MDVAAGFTYALTNSTRNTSLVVPELRPFQELILSGQASKRIQLQFRYRMDERFIHNNDRMELQEGYTFSLRHRFRLQGNVVCKDFENGKMIMARLSNEIMFHHGSSIINAFDQNRVYIGAEVQLNRKWSMELGYLNLYQLNGADQYFNRNIIRCTVFHRLSLLTEQ